MSMRRALPGDWPIRFLPEAVNDMRWLYREDPVSYRLVLDGLTMLAAERDPLHPRNPLLNVCQSYPYARGCFRLKVQCEDWRVVLRIMETRNGYTFHVEPDETLRGFATDQYLQVVMVDLRDNRTYSVRLARRWEKATAS